MRTNTLNTYKVTFHYTMEVEAEHEDEAPILAGSDFDRDIESGLGAFLRSSDMAYTVELIDGIEPGQEECDCVMGEWSSYCCGLCQKEWEEA